MWHKLIEMEGRHKWKSPLRNNRSGLLLRVFEEEQKLVFKEVEVEGRERGGGEGVRGEVKAGPPEFSAVRTSAGETCEVSASFAVLVYDYVYISDKTGAYSQWVSVLASVCG